MIQVTLSNSDDYSICAWAGPNLHRKYTQPTQEIHITEPKHTNFLNLKQSFWKKSCDFRSHYFCLWTSFVFITNRGKLAMLTSKGFSPTTTPTWEGKQAFKGENYFNLAVGLVISEPLNGKSFVTSKLRGDKKKGHGFRITSNGYLCYLLFPRNRLGLLLPVTIPGNWKHACLPRLTLPQDTRQCWAPPDIDWNSAWKVGLALPPE